MVLGFDADVPRGVPSVNSKRYAALAEKLEAARKQ